MQAHDSRTAGPPAAPVDAPETLRSRVRRLSVYFGNQRLAWSLAIGATLLGAVTEPLIPALLKPLLDRGFTQGSLSLWVIPLAIMGVFLVRGAAQFVGQYALTRIANEGMLILRNTLFERLLSADMALFSRQSASTLSNTVVYEVQTGATLLVQALLGLSRDGFTLLALLGYLLYLNWQLTLIVALVVPGVAWIMKTLSRRLYSLTKSSQKATDDLAYVVEENVLAHRMVRLHGAQPQPASPGHQIYHCLFSDDTAHPAAGCGRLVNRDLHCLVAEPLCHCGAGCHGGRVCCIHYRHAHADRSHPAAGGCGQPDHAWRGSFGARDGVAR